MTSLTMAVPASATSRRWLFALTILTGSFLLFCVQPLVARLALPRLGGAPAVWNSAMLVYQALLLAGYGWAHWLGRFPLRRQMALHGILLAVAALWLPLGLADLPDPGAGAEAWWVPVLLAVSIGPLFMAVAAQAPLIQRWFAADPGAGNPYPLYAASNLGSFAGLLSYPLLLEPTLTLVQQRWWWTGGYAALAVLVLMVMLARRNESASGAPERAAAADAADARPIAGRTIALWLMLSAVPSGLMLSTTTHLTTDVFAVPLMWVIPLALYLLSFTVAFAERQDVARIIRTIAPVQLVLGGGLALLSSGTGTMSVALVGLLLLFLTAVALHSRLYELRPEPARLTTFYLVMATGGVIGGLFAALVAPVLFDWVYEHPILVLAAALLLPLPVLLPWQALVARPDGPRAKPVGALTAVTGALVALAALLAWHLDDGFKVRMDQADAGLYLAIALIGVLVVHARWAFVTVLAMLMLATGGIDTLRDSRDGLRTRSYFGVYTVRDRPDAQQRTLAHGTTLHGTQRTAPGTERLPTSYYGETSGVGIALSRAPQLFGPKVRVGIVGLGTGTLACYRTAGSDWRFYEIDPAMADIARGKPFTFLPACAPDAPVILGDARLKLADAPPGGLDVLVIDAFSSDAIPLHLLTREALGIYMRALSPDGLLLIHISNRFFGLEPPLAAQVADAGHAAAIRFDAPIDADARALTNSDWVAIARTDRALGRLTGPLLVDRDGLDTSGERIWNTLAGRGDVAAWTDDHASILDVVRWENVGRSPQ